MRTLEDLIDTHEPGWDLVRSWIGVAEVPVEVLPRTQARAETCLVNLQVTTRSPMGAVAFESGGILVDRGWLRILGSGSDRLPRDLASWGLDRLDGALVVADDILGGFFALNGGGLAPDQLGAVFYFAPDSLEWEPATASYSEFLVFCFSQRVGQFYQDYRWDGWEAEVMAIPGDKALSIVPFLWTTEGRDIGRASRRPVPVEELWTLYVSG